jgi:hypothetical protein
LQFLLSPLLNWTRLHTQPIALVACLDVAPDAWSAAQQGRRWLLAMGVVSQYDAKSSPASPLPTLNPQLPARQLCVLRGTISRVQFLSHEYRREDGERAHDRSVHSITRYPITAQVCLLAKRTWKLIDRLEAARCSFFGKLHSAYDTGARRFFGCCDAMVGLSWARLLKRGAVSRPTWRCTGRNLTVDGTGRDMTMEVRTMLHRWMQIHLLYSLHCIATHRPSLENRK